MGASSNIASGRLERRFTGYAALALLIIVPAVVFVLLGVDAGSVGLIGFGGPLVAFSAGVLSFLSPCVLPLVPIYITQLAGTTVENGAVVASRRTTFSHAVAFVGGLSAVFVTLGASAGLFGFFVRDHQPELQQAAGFMMVAFGALLVPSGGARTPTSAAMVLLGVVAVFALLVNLARLDESPGQMVLLGVALFALWARAIGYLRLTFLSRTFQVSPRANRGVSYTRSALVGGAFATGWTPCIGPILGGVLTLAATSSHAWTGAYLLLFYSAGFSVPFLLTGLAVADVSRVFSKVKRQFVLIEFASALMMVGIGILLLAGRLTVLNQYFTFADFNQGL